MAKRRTGTITINPIKERQRSPPVNVVKVTSASSVTQFHSSIGSSTNVSKTKKYESAVNLLRQKKQQQQQQISDSKKPIESTGHNLGKNDHSINDNSDDTSSIVTTSSCSCEDHSDYDDDGDDHQQITSKSHSHGHDISTSGKEHSITTSGGKNCTSDPPNASQINKQEYKIKKATNKIDQNKFTSSSERITSGQASVDGEKGSKKSINLTHKQSTSLDPVYRKAKISAPENRDRGGKNKYEDEFLYEKSRDRGHRSRQEEEEMATFYDRHGHERISLSDRKRKYYDVDDNGHLPYHRHGHRDEYSSSVTSYYKRHHGHHEHSSYHYHSSNYDSIGTFHRSQDKMYSDLSSRKRQRSNYESYRSDSKDSFNHHQRQSTSRHKGNDRRSSNPMVNESINDEHHQSTSSTAINLNFPSKLNQQRKKPRVEDESKTKNKSSDKLNQMNTKLNDEINLNCQKSSQQSPTDPTTGDAGNGDADADADVVVGDGDGDDDEVEVEVDEDSKNCTNNKEDNANESCKSNVNINFDSNCLESNCNSSEKINLNETTDGRGKSNSPDAIKSGKIDEEKVNDVKESKDNKLTETKSNSTIEIKSSTSKTSLLVSSIGAIKSSKSNCDSSKTSRLAVKSYSDLLSYFFKDAIYFIMKSNIQDNIDIAMAKSLWSTPALNEAKLNHAFIYYRNVILIFSTKESGKFAGFARLTSPLKCPPNGRVNWVLPPGITEETFFNGAFELDWICKKDLQFTKTSHLFNPLNEGKPVKIARDGQQVDNAIAEQLLALFPPDESIDLIPLLKKMKRQTKNRPSIMPVVPMVPMMLHHHPHHQHHHSGDSFGPSATSGHGDGRNRESQHGRLSVHRRLGPKINLGRLGPIVTSNFNSNFDSGPYTSNTHPHRLGGGPWKRRR